MCTLALVHRVSPCDRAPGAAYTRVLVYSRNCARGTCVLGTRLRSLLAYTGMILVRVVV